MSDHIKERWSLRYYSQVMAMLDFLKSSGKEICGITPALAERLMSVLATYGYIDVYDYGDGSDLAPDTVVCVKLFDYELMHINTLWGYALAIGPELDGFMPPFDLDNEYAKAMIRKTEDYIKAQEEKRSSCLQAIRDYISECEANGTKPVKKRVAERTGFGYDFVREVWRSFDREGSNG